MLQYGSCRWLRFSDLQIIEFCKLFCLIWQTNLHKKMILLRNSLLQTLAPKDGFASHQSATDPGAKRWFYLAPICHRPWRQKMVLLRTSLPQTLAPKMVLLRTSLPQTLAQKYVFTSHQSATDPGAKRWFYLAPICHRPWRQKMVLLRISLPQTLAFGCSQVPQYQRRDPDLICLLLTTYFRIWRCSQSHVPVNLNLKFLCRPRLSCT